MNFRELVEKELKGKQICPFCLYGELNHKGLFDLHSYRGFHCNLCDNVPMFEKSIAKSPCSMEDFKKCFLFVVHTS